MIESPEAPSLLDSPSPDSGPRPEQDGASNETIATTLKTPSVLDTPAFGDREAAAFVRGKKKGWRLRDQYRLKNSLLFGVGMLELANAGDFAANVWNEIPVPRFAMVLMALGGTLALAISIFAFKDAHLSRENIRNLRAERRFLHTQKADLGAEVSREVHCQLDINFRELGTEYVDRLGMDIVMGFGSVMVGFGTFLAIDGANPRVFRASNLMSGYIGNAPVALYGLANAAFSVYVWRRAHRHSKAAAKETRSVVFRRRILRVKTHAAVNAVTGIAAGAASLVTATNWEGYPVLIPCIISAITCNYLWRNRIGYDRPLVRQRVILDKTSLMEELEHITSVREIFRTADPTEWFSKVIPDPESLVSGLEFLRSNDLFEDFCSRLLMDEALASTILGPLGQEIVITEQSLLAADKEMYPRIMGIGEETLKNTGPLRFKYRERYVLEALGCCLCSEGSARVTEKC
ncbi:hypothetical protein NA56DRAFT_579678 [Hyaloscypha hepaticicola]|uniref:Integral membrane protein n=1 Tax=Hyaloscypha hepaticicola TaxID=2082293 RepID=A0A2J6PST3_9HELO|nr:hypothetical protein NA56DRAFT_579678 [Hyaloscypha hepaticicola]